MRELLNINELKNIISAAEPSPDHRQLLSALNDRYPKTPFQLQEENAGRTWSVGIIDQTGKRLTDRIGQWVDQQLVEHGGSAQAVWRKYKDTGLIRTERVGSVLYLVAPYGPDQDQFYQLEVLCGPEMTTQKLFDPDPLFPAEDRHDLLNGPPFMFSDSERTELAPAEYEFSRLVNIRRFLSDLIESKRLNNLERLPELEKKVVHIQEVSYGDDCETETFDIPFLDLAPNWLDRTPPELRLFQDWAESSAGKNRHRLCDHWWMQTNEWPVNGRKQYSLVPQWAAADGGLDLPIISPDWEASPYSLMEQLQQFDRRVGYPFAWYFYMLHGNRITHSAGSVIGNAIKEGHLGIPECDEKVLLRWRDLQYGF